MEKKPESKKTPAKSQRRIVKPKKFPEPPSVEAVREPDPPETVSWSEDDPLPPQVNNAPATPPGRNAEPPVVQMIQRTQELPTAPPAPPVGQPQVCRFGGAFSHISNAEAHRELALVGYSLYCSLEYPLLIQAKKHNPAVNVGQCPFHALPVVEQVWWQNAVAFFLTSPGTTAEEAHDLMRERRLLDPREMAPWDSLSKVSKARYHALRVVATADIVRLLPCFPG